MDKKRKHSIDFTAAQHRWLRIEAAKAGCSVGEFVRRMIDEKRGAK